MILYLSLYKTLQIITELSAIEFKCQLFQILEIILNRFLVQSGSILSFNLQNITNNPCFSLFLAF